MIDDHVAATDDLDALLVNLHIVLGHAGDPLPVDRKTLERWSRHAGRALLYLLEHPASSHPSASSTSTPDGT